MPRKIYLIRHGETEANRMGIIQGQGNNPLNNTGKSQAKQLAKVLTDHHFDAIYSSDLIRTQQTAKPLAQHKKLSISKKSELRERHHGEFEGKVWDDVIANNPNYIQEAYRQDVSPFDMENNQDLIKRIKPFFVSQRALHPNKIIAVFTHGGLKRNIIAHLTNKPVSEETDIRNTSVTILKKLKPGLYKIDLLADTSHLKEA